MGELNDSACGEEGQPLGTAQSHFLSPNHYWVDFGDCIFARSGSPPHSFSVILHLPHGNNTVFCRPQRADSFKDGRERGRGKTRQETILPSDCYHSLHLWMGQRGCFKDKDGTKAGKQR